MEKVRPNSLYLFLYLFSAKLDFNEHLLRSGPHLHTAACCLMEAAASEFTVVIQLCQILP